MAVEIKALLWLQWKLLLTVFRSRRADAFHQFGQLVLALFMIVFTLPFFALCGVGLALLLAVISPAAGVEIVLLVNTGLFFLWLMMPASYNRDLMERLDLTRLFPHPISLAGIAVGTTLTSLLSPIGLAAVLVLAGEVVGIAWHAPLLLPLILLGAVVALAVMALTERLLEDLLDLVAGDRRLRGLLMFLMMLPLFAFLILTYGFQILVSSQGGQPAWWTGLVGSVPPTRGLGPVRGLEVILLYFHPSQVLAWLPTGWGSAGMAWPLVGEWLPGLGCLALALGLCVVMIRTHGAIIRRLMEGHALHFGSARVRDERMPFDMPGPPALGALVAKDWICLRRSPLTKQVLFASPLLLVVFGFSAWQISRFLPPTSPVRMALPFLAGAVLLVSVNLAMINFTCNYFGAIDREGFSGLMLAPIEPHLVLLSQGVVTLLFALAQALVLFLIVAALTGAWTIIPWGLLTALLVHISTLPAYNLVGIVSPYRAEMTLSSKNQGNLWMVLAWMIAPVPCLALSLIPIFTWPPLLLFTLPAAALYAGLLYILTLRPLARLMLRRSHRILEVVARES